MMNAALFARIDELVSRRADLGLTAEQDRVLGLYHRMFVRAGARLEGADRERLTEVLQRLASLGTAFGQNVLADERAWSLALDGADLEGLPDWLIAAAAEAASERGKDGHAVTLSRSLIVPFLTTSPRRDLREAAFRAWVARGENGGASDNRAVIAEMLALREERARLLGYPDFAAYRLEREMARTPRGGARPADAGLGAGARAGRGGRGGAGDAAQRRRDQRHAGALGLALLRRHPPARGTRARRGGGEALPRARRRARGVPSTWRGGSSG